jgi:hypothetical protein
VPSWFNSCRLTVARPGGKLMANDLEAGSRDGEPASDLLKLVGDTGIEPVTSSVSTGTFVRIPSWLEVGSLI